MSRIENPSNTPETATVEVLRSSLEEFISGGNDMGLEGEYLWPIPPASLSKLYRASSEHGRAIHLKAEGAFGGGLIGATERFEELIETGSSELFVLLGLDLETYGNAFLQIIRSRQEEDRIIGLRRLPAITMARTEKGFIQKIRKPGGDTQKITFAKNEILHLREPCPHGQHYSYPSWIGAESMLALADAATRYNAAFFSNNAMPEYAIKFIGATPSKEQKDNIRDFFRSEFQGFDKQHRTLLLEVGEDAKIEIERLTADVKDGDFLKLIDAARDRIPVAHGTPPRMLGIMTAGQLGGGGEVTGQLFNFELLTLKPRRRRMLDQIRPILKSLGLKPGNTEEGLQEGEIAFRPLDLTPPQNDAENLPELVQSGIFSREEARAIHPALSGKNAGKIERSAAPSALQALAAILAKS